MKELLTDKPDGISEGQALTSFLTWLNEEKGYKQYDYHRIADISGIPDGELGELYQAFLDDYFNKYQT